MFKPIANIWAEGIILVHGECPSERFLVGRSDLCVPDRATFEGEAVQDRLLLRHVLFCDRQRLQLLLQAINVIHRKVALLEFESSCFKSCPHTIVQVLQSLAKALEGLSMI